MTTEDHAFDRNLLGELSIEELVMPRRLGSALVSATGDDRWKEFHAELIVGGKSNLTFELTSEAGSLILRRPPAGTLLPSAHDVMREVRAQRALLGTAVRVPMIVHSDPDGEILGVPFYVMEKVPGMVIRDVLPRALVDSVDERRRLSHELIGTLALLHSIPPDSVGLSRFGRPHGFVSRQIRRWESQWNRLGGVQVLEVDKLIQVLKVRATESRRVAILHGDYRLDNCLIDEGDPGRIAAVLDWEMSTLGDPLIDLGMFLFYWRNADDHDLRIVQSVTSHSGFPSREEMTERYVKMTGVGIDDLAFYLAFANFKFAIITRDVASRSVHGGLPNQNGDELTDVITECARVGLSLVGG